ncbi:hypothetical protein N9954_08940 [Maribacter sp.]|nr:hypothetical protein [Maribacter sp.]
MNIIINDQAVSKSELLQLIKKSKIRAVRSIRKTAHIGLKDAKDIVDKLAKNPNYYDDEVITLPTRGSRGVGQIKADLEDAQYKEDLRQRKPIAGKHFLKAGRSNKLLFFGLVGLALFLIYYFMQDSL